MDAKKDVQQDEYPCSGLLLVKQCTSAEKKTKASVGYTPKYGNNYDRIFKTNLN